MATASAATPTIEAPATFRHGERLDQKTFHARYELTPEDFKAELIEGVVYVAAASMKRPHGRHHIWLSTWLGHYEMHTPGVEAYDNSTIIMGEFSEPQPDACLLIHPDKGGQATFDEKNYVVGSPELMAEVSDTTERFDLGAKKRDYLRAGVREYIVVALEKQRVFWFIRRGDDFEELTADGNGILHSETFPGLWLDADALLQLDGRRLIDGLSRGVGSDEHGRFAARLAQTP